MIIILEDGFYMYIWYVHFSVRIKVKKKKKKGIKMYGFWIIKGLVCLCYFGTVTISCILICTVCWICLYFDFVGELDLIFLIWAYNLGIYFTIWICYCEVWLGHLDQCVLSWLNNGTNICFRASKKLNFNQPEQKTNILYIFCGFL